MSEVVRCLTAYQLEQYAAALQNAGLDSLNDMKNLSDNDIDQLANELQIPFVHKKRLKTACNDVRTGQYPKITTNNYNEGNPNTNQAPAYQSQMVQQQPIQTMQPVQQQPVQQVVYVTAPPNQTVVAQQPTNTGANNNNNNNNNVKGKVDMATPNLLGLYCFGCCSCIIWLFLLIAISMGQMYISTASSNGTSYTGICWTTKRTLDVSPGTNPSDLKWSDLCDGSTSLADKGCDLKNAGAAFTALGTIAFIFVTCGCCAICGSAIGSMGVMSVSDSVSNNFKYIPLCSACLYFVSAIFILAGSLNFTNNGAIDDLCELVISGATHRMGGSPGLGVTSFVFLLLLICMIVGHFAVFGMGMGQPPRNANK